ncbi:MAG: NUDIX hydrolase [Acidimicrobiales bacterium]
MSELDLAREAIADFVPSETAQERAQRHMLAFVDGHPDALHRSCAAGHLTASAVVLSADSTKALFLLHAKARRWFQPGGHADGMTDMSEVALKEANEETGIVGLVIEAGPIDLDVHEVNFRGESAHLHLDLRYLIRAPHDAQEIANEESLALAWHDLPSLAGLGVDDSTMRVARIGLRLGAGSVT